MTITGALLVALAIVGLRPLNLAVAALVLVSAFRAWRLPAAPTSAPFEPLLVGLASLVVLAGGFALADADRPLATDWMAYLRNAVALDTGDLDPYQRWRGPLHGWACLAATHLTGNLVAGSQLVSLVSATACVPLTWRLARRIFGPVAGLLAVGLFAGWADLALFAASSTPYPLYAALTLAGLTLAIESRERARLAMMAGVSLGLAIVVDLRGEAVLATAVLASAADPGALKTRLLRAVFVGVTGAVVGAGTLAAAPVELIPLAEQVALQRDLNAREGVGACPPRGMAMPTLGDLALPCARVTAAGNLGRANAAIPIGLPAMVVLLLAGAVLARRSAPWLVLPLLPLVPSLFLFGLQHRYFVPVAPLLATLAAGALLRLSPPGRARPWLLGSLVLTLAIGWVTWPGGLVSRARTGRNIDPALSLAGPQTYPALGETLRTDLEATDRVVDCTRAGFNLRLYPHPVEVSSPKGPGQRSKKCRELLEQGPRSHTWLLVTLSETDPVSERWAARGEVQEGPGVYTRLLEGG